MNTHLHYALVGLGGTADTAVGISTSVAEKIVPTAIGPTVAAMLSIPLTVAIPVVGAVIAGISIGIEAILHSGCGQTCIVTSQWANQAEQHLQQNIAAYFAIPAPRPKSVQQIAVANFQAIWNVLVQQCSQPGLGGAGQRCISDRQAGACKWKASGPGYPGGPASGACWNWWNGYHDPIANDPNVVDDTVSSAVSSILPAGVTTVLSSAGISPTMLLLAGAAVVLVVVAS